MSGLLYGIGLQWKIDFRRRDVLIMYYIMPIAFFLFMGGVFTSVNPGMNRTLIFAMTIFAVSAGGFNGAPASVNSFYTTDMKKAYKVGGIPLWTVLLNGYISALIHLTIVSTGICILSPLLFGADTPAHIPLFALVTPIFILCTVSIGMLLGVFVKSQSRLSMFSVLCFLPSIALSGIMFPSEVLPSFVRTISRFIPAHWAFNAMQGVNVGLNMLLMLAVIVLAVAVMAIRLRKIAKE